TNSVMDIGYHYVALDTSPSTPVPFDTDGGGVPDYLEDANGNGTNDVGETDWSSGHSSDDYDNLLTPEYLRCEYLQNPLGVDTNYGPPRLFWIVKSSRRAQVQTAYQILAASSLDN